MQPPIRSLLALSAAASCAAASLGSSAAAQARFQSFDFDFYSAQDVSADGSVIVGTFLFGSPIFTYDDVNGLVVLDGGYSSPVSISDDASVVQGNVLDVNGNPNAARWTAATGWEIIGPYPGVTMGCPDLSDGYAISGDGQVIVGLGWTMCEATAFRWEASTGMVDLGSLPSGGGVSRANAVDNSGDLVVGWDQAVNGTRRAVIWMNGVESQLGSLDPNDPIDGGGEAYSVTRDGTQVFGESAGFMFRWTQSGGLENLGQLAPGGPFDMTIPLGVSDDGTVAVGQSGGFFGNPVKAFYYRDDIGIVDLRTLLRARGATGLDDWMLTSAAGVSADGNVVVGLGVDGNGIPQMYRAYLQDPTPPCGDGGVATATFRSDAAGLNQAGFTAPPPVLGTSWVATVDNTGTGSTIAGVVAYLTPLDIALPFGSSLLVNIADPAGELLRLPSASGTDIVTFKGYVPSDEGLCGLSFSAQGFALGGGQGIKLLNAYDCVIGGF